MVLSIGIQNHSPVSVFMGNIFIETRTGEQVFVKDDVITGEWQRPRELRPGESFEFNINPAELMKFSGLGLICAAMRDAIGRVYRSTEAELRNALRGVGYELPRATKKLRVRVQAVTAMSHFRGRISDGICTISSVSWAPIGNSITSPEAI